MTDTKNIILVFGNKEFNNSLSELKEYLNFNLETVNDYKDLSSIENYQGLIIHEDALKDRSLKEIIKNNNVSKILVHNSKNITGSENIEKLPLPTSIDQINSIVMNNIVKKKFATNSSLKIKDYKLDKNSRRLIKNKIYLELTEKEIELIELLNENRDTCFINYCENTI